MKSLTEYIKENPIGIFNESTLGGTKSSPNEMGETIYQKLFKGERLTVQELKWTDTNVGIVKIDRAHLRDLIKNLRYNDISLNWIDVSDLTNLSNIFEYSDFNGDISKWDVSNATDMMCMFSDSKFNGDISKWDVRKVSDMSYMFFKSQFTGDISKWDVSRVTDMEEMFYNSNFNGDISKWDISKVKNMSWMFFNSKFNRDISEWDVKSSCKVVNMFLDCPIKNEYKPKSLQD